jgi:hypothetical protein
MWAGFGRRGPEGIRNTVAVESVVINVSFVGNTSGCEYREAAANHNKPAGTIPGVFRMLNTPGYSEPGLFRVAAATESGANVSSGRRRNNQSRANQG